MFASFQIGHRCWEHSMALMMVYCLKKRRSCRSIRWLLNRTIARCPMRCYLLGTTDLTTGLTTENRPMILNWNAMTGRCFLMIAHSQTTGSPTKSAKTCQMNDCYPRQTIGQNLERSTRCRKKLPMIESQTSDCLTKQTIESQMTYSLTIRLTGSLKTRLICCWTNLTTCCYCRTSGCSNLNFPNCRSTMVCSDSILNCHWSEKRIVLTIASWTASVN
jgi:hypothetical protein